MFSTASRLALGPAQSPIRWVPGDLSPKLKRPGREADHSPQSCVEVKNGGTVQQETIVARERLFKHVFTATNSRDRNKRHGRNNKGIVCDVFYVVRADIIQEGPQAEA